MRSDVVDASIRASPNINNRGPTAGCNGAHEARHIGSLKGRLSYVDLLVAMFTCFFGYGLSLALYTVALRGLGAARGSGDEPLPFGDLERSASGKFERGRLSHGVSSESGDY